MFRSIARLAAALALLVTLGGVLPSARAAELVMVERDGCPWCAAFDREIAPIYGRTPEARRAPLRRIDLNQTPPADLAFLQIERLTPVFILVDKGREIGRIRGYPGPEGFWTQLAILMDRLPQPAAQDQAALATPLRAAD
jgi:hypothetical protein